MAKLSLPDIEKKSRTHFISIKKIDKIDRV